MHISIIFFIAFFILLFITVIFIPPSIGPGVVILLLVLFAVLNFAGDRIFKPREREVVIIDKRITERDMPYDPKVHTSSETYYTFRNATVDYSIAGRRFVHTATCSDDVYKKLKVGETYTVGIYSTEIRYIKK